ncbi:tRNA (adenosine(37)-N6)-dimethylallyltransferase MiaA [Candidatus Parcubacteria bacterium]|nr:tRNA (adenosine(37)-N6)-dimethylallyltransferase MiaA [Candidatus Parcubacteria bacterium]
MDNKLVVILGQTASGKTDLSIKLARKFKGEIISADSRQVYKGLDIGTGKITKKEMQGIPHHALDIASPKKRVSVAQYQKMAIKAAKDIQKSGRLPFLVGGTGFYIQSVVDGIIIPEVKPNWKLRKELERKTTEELFLILKESDPLRAETIDQKNPTRLIRAIEIVTATKKPIGLLQKNPQFEVLQLGIKKSPEELKRLIKKRLDKRMKGMIAEVKKLQRSGLSWKRLEELGLEYRFTAKYLQGKISQSEMIASIQKESEHFAKRQMTWFKREKRIRWIKNQKEAEALIKKFIN